MTIRDRLRSTSSIVASSNSQNTNTVNNDDDRVVTGIALSCDDMSDDGVVCREYKIVRGVHRTVDFIRASAVHPSGRISVAASGAARATFSNPVMSRRHARITFTEDGSVTVMDVGSMHGTSLVCVDYDDFFPERLKPRRHYTLRSGDVLQLGKAINRDEKEWQPVTIRVTFMHDEAARFVTPPPNRYGMYITAGDASDVDEDDDACSISSSSGEDDDSRGHSGSSPDNSPTISHVPLQLDVAVSASVSRESFHSGSRNGDDLPNISLGMFDSNRSMSAKNVLRAIMPTMPGLSAMRRLPSIRELGLFRSANSSSIDVSEAVEVVDVVQDTPLPNPEVNAEVPDTTTHASPPIESPNSNSYQDVVQSAESLQSAGVEDDGTSGSIFPWQEPSHPQNQLGLELNEESGFYVGQTGEETNERDQSVIELRSPQCLQEDNNNEGQSGEMKARNEEVHDDEKSMDISPCSSRVASPTPSFRACAVFDADPASDAMCSGSPEPEEQQHCRCHEGEEQPREVQPKDEEEKRQQEDSSEQAKGGLLPAAPVTPQPRRFSSHLTPPSAAGLDSERRRSRAARYEYDPIPSPVSISRRGKRGGARLGPTLKSPAPNPPGPFTRVGRVHADKSGITRHASGVEVLQTQLRSLEMRIRDVQEHAMKMASFATATASTATASTSLSTVTAEEARKEMELMREETRRLSGLIETLVAKIEAREGEASRIECGVQADSSARANSEMMSSTSHKRKRSEGLTLANVEEEMLSRGMVWQLQENVPMAERIRSFYEPVLQPPEVRLAKRARTGVRDGTGVMTVAAAAGFTGLGAALTWVTLAYVL